MGTYYPESKVEISGFVAKYYDTIMNVITLGKYSSLIQKAIQLMQINPNDKILDLGAGTGRNACLMMKYLSEQGELIGLDISQEMIDQFKKNCAQFPNANIINKRIDQDLDYKEHFDKVFISFVLHGFPQNVREVIVRNAFKALKNGSSFFILDYNEFSMRKMPFYLRIPFKRIECKYAFDFIEMDCKKMLSLAGFKNFEEHLFLSGYVRLLSGMKVSA
jgi:demethylmenaquinone methyltransferase/2-methoxy-6-polyprenyl-1,4-benzoquinol methylase